MKMSRYLGCAKQIYIWSWFLIQGCQLIFNPGNSTSPSSESATTPGVFTSPMIQTCLSFKVISLGWLLPNVLTRAITVSGMGIKSQLLREISCLSSITWTCIRLVDYHWYQGRFPPWFWELIYCVGYTPHAPDSTVLDVDRGDFWSLRYFLTWQYWSLDCMGFLP